MAAVTAVLSAESAESVLSRPALDAIVAGLSRVTGAGSTGRRWRHAAKSRRSEAPCRQDTACLAGAPEWPRLGIPRLCRGADGRHPQQGYPGLGHEGHLVRDGRRVSPGRQALVDIAPAGSAGPGVVGWNAASLRPFSGWRDPCGREAVQASKGALPARQAQRDRRRMMRLVVSIDAEGDNQLFHGAPLTTQNVAFWAAVHGPLRPVWRPADLPRDLGGYRGPHRSRPAFALEGRSPHRSGGPSASLEYTALPGRTGLAKQRLGPSLSLRSAGGASARQTCHAYRPDRGSHGRTAMSFRAGRFGFDAKCSRVLADLGYLVDSSVTPLVSWRETPGLPGGPGGPDFRASPVTPFLIAGAEGLLELPVTIMHTDWWTRRYSWNEALIRSRPWRAARRLLHRGRGLPSPLWLRPVPRSPYLRPGTVVASGRSRRSRDPRHDVPLK